MRAGKAKRLHASALREYQNGYADGATARKRDRDFIVSDDTHPAYAAGYALGRADKPFDRTRLPLDVWALVIAYDCKPTLSRYDY